MGDRRGVALDESPPPSGDAEMTIHFFGTEFDYDTDVPARVPSGVPIRIVFTNEGAVDHDLTFPISGVYLRAAPGESSETIAVFAEPETYFCSIGGHADVGMFGDLVVDGEHPASDEIDRSDGNTEMWWYEPGTDSFTPAPVLPHALDHVTFVNVGDDVYSIGGFSGDIGTSDAAVYVLTDGAAEWERRTDFPVARAAMAGASDGERIFVTGGRSESEGTPSDTDLFIYHPDEDRWEVAPASMPTGRDHVSGAFLDGVFWVIGGRGDGRRVSPTPVTEGYDTTTGRWIHGARLPVASSAAGLAALGSSVVFFGGEGPRPTAAGAAGRSFQVFADTLVYETTADRWERAPDMAMPVHHPAYGVIDETLISIGGAPISGVSATRASQALTLG